MKKLFLLSIVGLMGLTASAQTTISFPGRLKNDQGEVTIDKEGTTKIKFKCDPWYPDDVCMTMTSSGPILMPSPRLTLTLFNNNYISQILQIENYQGMEYKETSKESEVSIYFRPNDNNQNSN